MHIQLIPVLSDNYCYAIIDEQTKQAAIVDPGETEPVESFLKSQGLKLTDILLTHHHGDHIHGANALKTEYQATIWGAEKDAHRIPILEKKLSEGDEINILGKSATVIETPGHTSGHICFWFKDLCALFCGDTLFSMGCGRLFEGTAEEMWDSLQKIMALPDETQIYCGHEYTMSNAQFCQTIEPDNIDLQERINEVKTLRESGKPSLPVTLGVEKKTNVFLRAGSAEDFAKVRKQKDDA